MVVGQYSLKSYQYHVEMSATQARDCKLWCTQQWGPAPNSSWNRFGINVFGFNDKNVALMAVLKFNGQYENYTKRISR